MLANKIYRPSWLMIESPESPLPPTLEGKEDPMVETSCGAAAKCLFEAIRLKTKSAQTQFLMAAFMDLSINICLFLLSTINIMYLSSHIVQFLVLTYCSMGVLIINSPPSANRRCQHGRRCLSVRDFSCRFQFKIGAQACAQGLGHFFQRAEHQVGVESLQPADGWPLPARKAAVQKCRPPDASHTAG